ncbi:Catalase-1 isoform B [Elsinoe australis]|uniref:Catalase-1 isoform B n=1 Tax=Elsinoe australis TaxID=40998 RepID=A0A2P7ZTU8_9PEZI|nr:Catalase-1 isoform B [Elsinoe australis]
MSKVADAISGDRREAHMMSANEGPMSIISKVSGHSTGGKREDDGPYFTNSEGIPLPDAEHSKNIGGIPLVSDVHLLQKQQRFNRSKNLERMVHPCGSGAFGYFETTADVSDMTKADFLQRPGEKTPVFVRFSTVTLGREFPDEARNPRGFAIKFYTREGNYDIVGLNFPIFFCRDPIQGPHVIRSQARNPKNFLLDYDATFDLLGCTPEGNHAGLMFFSDHDTPDGWINEHGYGCHTFKWVNKEGKFVYIKYHLSPSMDPDYSKRQLWEAIEKGQEIEWTAKVQIMQPQDADPEKLGFDPFDVTKVWPRGQFPMHDFGRLVLDKNPENYHRDVEQAAFSPGSMVPGIEDSPDPLLQFRMFFYRDAQYHRIGINLHQVPVNCPFMSEQQRKNLHSNTAKMMSRVNFPITRKKYLAQIYNIAPEYARGVYDLTKFKNEKFAFEEVEQLAKDAPTFYKTEIFRPDQGNRLVGFAPESPFYHV